MPKVFVSSTFYDLRYAREDLGEFIKGYGFSPIMFENGDVGFPHGIPLDESCYEAMRNADMAILIIGGRYGSQASDSTVGNKFDNYLSITRKEFSAATQANVPIYVFIEESVASEYLLYKKNKSTLESREAKIEFAAVDNINVHRFIEEVHNHIGQMAVSFQKISDIKNILRKQWADMFKRYLILRRQENQIKKLEPSVDRIYSQVRQMDIMLSKVGEKIIGSDLHALEDVQQRQKIEDVSNKIASCFEFLSNGLTHEKIKEYLFFFTLSSPVTKCITNNDCTDSCLKSE